MAINMTKQNGNAIYGVCEYVVDTVDDIAKLPTKGILAGSTAFVIATSKVYILNSSGEWKEL